MVNNSAQNISDADDTCHFVVVVGHVQSMNSVLAHVLNHSLESDIWFDSDWFRWSLKEDVNTCLNRL